MKKKEIMNIYLNKTTSLKVQIVSF